MTAEERFIECGVLNPDKEVSSAVEAVSFDDTLGEMGQVIEEGLSEDRVIPVNSVEMYEVIADFGQRFKLGQMARVDTRYKTVDRKVRPVEAPLHEGSEKWMKEVVLDPSLRDPDDIGHRFTDKTLRELKVGGGGFLLPANEE